MKSSCDEFSELSMRHAIQSKQPLGLKGVKAVRSAVPGYACSWIIPSAPRPAGTSDADRALGLALGRWGIRPGCFIADVQRRTWKCLELVASGELPGPSFSTTICTTYTCLCVPACVYIYIPHTHKHTRCMLVFVCTCDSAETNRETVETQILNDPLKLNKTLHFSQYILPLAFGFFKYPRTRKKQNELFSSSI